MSKIKYLVALISLVIALVLSFGLLPLMINSKYQKKFYLQAKNLINQNQVISKDDIEYVELVDYHLASDLVEDINEVVGHQSSYTIVPQTLIHQKMITEKVYDGRIDDKLNEFQLFSIELNKSAYAVNDILQKGDIVNLYSSIDKEDKYLEKIEIADINYQDDKRIVSLYLNLEQAKLLSYLVENSTIYLSLVKRYQDDRN